MTLIELVRQAGVVGAGGAGFPTHVKLNTRAEYLIINGAECEPLIETDKYLCRTRADAIVRAAVAVGGHLGARELVIALKGKYRPEIDALQGAISRQGAPVRIFEMPTFYPAGDEQIMVQMVTGRSVPEGGIPIDVGAVVDNVGTMVGIDEALAQQPVTHKFLSVVGEVAEPLMLQVPLGTRLSECVDAAGPTLAAYGLIVGGPMMGKQLLDEGEIEKAVVTKTTGNLIVLPRDHPLFQKAALPIETVKRRAKSSCIQCRMCTDLCPRHLIGHQIRPSAMMRSLWLEDEVDSDKGYLRLFGESANCCDCGVCEMFACPMDLSPRKVNSYLKGQLRARGLKPVRRGEPCASADIDLRRIPTDRLITRLGLAVYSGKHAARCDKVTPDQVFLPLSQHIGKPAVPCVAAGDSVTEGQLIAAAAEGLSANLHASLTGTVLRVDPLGILLRRKDVK